MHHVLLILALFAFIQPTATRKLVADKKLSTITYAAKHPLHKWEGISRDVNSAVVYNDETRQPKSVAVSIRVASFDSRNSNRDSYAIEVLEGLKYPNVTFVSSSVKANGDGTLDATGNLTFHGITRPTTLHATRTETGGKMSLVGEFPVSLTEFRVERPSLLGLKTNDEMTLSFNVVFPLQ